MSSKNKVLIKIATYTAAIVYIIFLIFKRPSIFKDYIEIIPNAITIATLISLFFNNCIWKHIPGFISNLFPSIKVPVLKNEYIGTIRYKKDEKCKEKSINIYFYQTFTTVRIKLTTDEIESNSITADIIEERGEYILYYTYITNPRSEYSENNPIQHGTCRLCITNLDDIKGTYWTSRKTIGDVYLK